LKSINLVVLGDHHRIATELGGKRGTTSDIVIYDRKTLDTLYSWIAPVTFPAKIQPLMQAINIAEYAILDVTKIDKYLGEQILALDCLDFRHGFILHSYDIDEAKLNVLIKNTSVSHFKLIDNIDQLKYEVSRLKPKPNAEEVGEEKDNLEKGRGSNHDSVVIPIDHAFDVKGVGSVILGVIKQGIVKVHDQLKIMPVGKDIIVKSIQMHDDAVQESKCPARVGLAVKGITADEISRGDILCYSQDNHVNVLSTAGTISTIFQKNPYYKEDLVESQTYMVSIGLQIRPVKIKNHRSNTIEITAEKPIVYMPCQRYVLLKPDSHGTRIIGQGTIQ
jgi:selenocysteine-specific translation elongation factor